MSFNTHDTFNKPAEKDTDDTSMRSSKRRGPTLPSRKTTLSFGLQSTERSSQGGLVFETGLSLFLSKLLPVVVYPVGAASVLALIGGLLAIVGSRRSAATSAVSAGLLLWATKRIDPSTTNCSAYT